MLLIFNCSFRKDLQTNNCSPPPTNLESMSARQYSGYQPASPTDSDVFILLPTYVVLCYAQDVGLIVLLRHSYLWNGEGGFDGAVRWKGLGWVDAVCDIAVGRPRRNVMKWKGEDMWID